MLQSEKQRVRRAIPGPGFRENLGVTPKCPDTQKSNGAEPLRQAVLPSRPQRLCKARQAYGPQPSSQPVQDRRDPGPAQLMGEEGR